MISEPELVGGTVFPAVETVRIEPPPPRPPRPRRPWLWALGGVVVASAVWAGGLYAYERSQDGGPDLGGYRAVENLCAKAELKALSVALGKKSTDAETPTEKHPALDKARCSTTLGPPETAYNAMIVYDLHKVTDPGPEFEPDLGESGLDVERIAGLGEQAFFHVDADNSGAWMRVLDGQVELEIWIYVQEDWDAETNQTVPTTKKADLSGIDTVLAQDMKALMAALKK
ncbi:MULTISPECIES: hypothetical protein [Streptomyces]|uniref:hypothetical protein n=1 Tax=Streptomyces TaxID=1883 RepID=UPI001317CE47|nr:MULTISPECIES: hypothetical protein [Streptomyces]QGZ50720.1 hypothetical protein GPZ77_22210 [Streptomyces sp. QHH-9511]GGT83127.1 hypothetical protein GCM10010272_29710 [Streptomyces lateritius]